MKRSYDQYTQGQQHSNNEQSYPQPHHQTHYQQRYINHQRPPSGIYIYIY